MSKIYYCPRCGRLEKEESYKISDTCSCRPPFNPKLLPMEEEYEDFDLEKPMTKLGFTKDMYDLACGKYVNIPSNKKFNQVAFEQEHGAKANFFASGKNFNPNKFVPPVTPTVRCPRCNSTSISTQKKGFGVGKAAAGVLTVGTPGALAGAVGANKVYNICQNCGHKWEPGK